MKQLQLDLKRRLLIIEGFIEPNNLKLRFICKGSELTEEIAKGFCEYDEIFKAYQYYHDTVPILGNTALNLFKTAIKNYNYHWEKPLESDFYHRQYVDVDRMKDSFEYELYREAVSRTFNPEKTLIFEIL